MKAYRPVPAAVHRLVQDVVLAVAPELRKVKFAVVGIESDSTEPDVVAVKILGPVARAAGAADVAVLIDLAAWSALDDEAREAWIDSAVSGLRVTVRDGVLTEDMAGRPLVRRRRPDFRVASFRDVVTRRGHKAPGSAGAVSMLDVLRETTDPRSRSGRVKVVPATAFG